MTTAALDRIRSQTQTLSASILLWQMGLCGVALFTFWLLWVFTARTVTVSVDGYAETVRTHRHTVGVLLVDLGITLHPNDQVSPSVEAQLNDETTIHVRHATPVHIIADRRTAAISSWGVTVEDVLRDAQIQVDPYDMVLVNSTAVALDEPLPKPVQKVSNETYSRAFAWQSVRTEPHRIEVLRAVPIVVKDGGLPFVIRTTAETIGEALREAELTIYLGDRVDPSLGSEVVTGLRVTIQRSLPSTIHVDGRWIKTRTRGRTVADALADLQITLAGLDQVEPSLDTLLYEDIGIEITRIREDVEIEEEIASYETTFVADRNLPIDTQELVSPGAEGVTRTRYRMRYENGLQVDRTLEDTWTAQEPSERVIAYGQRIEPLVINSPDGNQITYWRKIRMLASSYSASTAGVSPDQPYYGRTYTGEPMRFGVVAVDPGVIPLHSELYIPEYGRGSALDTGSAIRARRIDLGYDDDNLVLWNKWVDVYLLWPPPPESQITWVLPNWPLPPQ